MSLHECHELTQETITVNDPTVLKTITDEFQLLKYLGSGQSGHVYLMARTPEEQMAMKVMPCSSSSEQEIRTSCLLNSIRSETGIFAYTYGWLSCANFPSHLLPYIIEGKAPKPNTDHIFMFSEYVPFAWNDPSFRYTDTDFRIMVFLLLHGIYIGRRELEFFHHDIHEGNIMLRNIFHTEVVKVKTIDVEFEISGARFVPKLYAKPESTNNKNRFKVSDLQLLAEEFFRVMVAQKNLDARRAFLKFKNGMQFEEACKESASNYQVVNQLLNHEYFNIPEIKRLDREPEGKKLKFVERCIMCTTPAKMIYQGTDLTFCGKRCAAKSQRIASLLLQRNKP